MTEPTTVTTLPAGQRRGVHATSRWAAERIDAAGMRAGFNSGHGAGIYASTDWFADAIAFYAAQYDQGDDAVAYALTVSWTAAVSVTVEVSAVELYEHEVVCDMIADAIADALQLERGGRTSAELAEAAGFDAVLIDCDTGFDRGVGGSQIVAARSGQVQIIDRHDLDADQLADIVDGYAFDGILAWCHHG